MTRDGSFLPVPSRDFRSPAQNVLADVRCFGSVPLDGVGVWLIRTLCNDHLNRSSCPSIGLQGLAVPLSNTPTIAIALVSDTMDILLPGISNLVEGTSFGILALINGIALPSPTTLAKARAVQHVPLIMTLVERLVHIIGDTIHNALISELGVCNASPLSTAISYAGTSHHVAHIVLFIPLVPNTVHDTIIGGADFLVGSHRAEAKFLVSIIVLSGSTPLHVVSPSLRSTVSIVAVVVQEGEVAQSTVGIATTCLDQNILLSTEGVSPVLLKVGSGAAPEVPICAAFSSARVESPPVVGERQNTGFSIRIATICLGHSYFLAADSIAQTSTKHLLAALCLQIGRAHV